MTFASLLAEVRGLAGAKGLYPCAQTVARLGTDFGPRALFAYFPSLLHLTGAADGALLALGAAGLVLALIVAFDVAPRQLRAARWPFAALGRSPSVGGRVYLTTALTGCAEPPGVVASALILRVAWRLLTERTIGSAAT